MKDETKTRKQLIQELGTLRERCAELEKLADEHRRTEESIAYLASFPELNPNAIAELDFVGTVHYINAAAKELFPDLQAIGVQHPWFEDWKSVVAIFAGDRKISCVREIRIGNFWYEQAIHYIPEGGRIRIYGFEITDRKRAEQRLQESEERYRTLFETMTQGVVYQDVQGKIISVNPAAERILGLTSDQMQGRTSMDPMWKTMHEDGSDFPGETHPIVVAAKTGTPVENVVMGVYHPRAGEYRWIKIDAVPQFRPGEEKPSKVYVTFDDITERKRVEERLKESETKYRELYEGSQDGFVMVDMEGNIKEFNQSYKEMLGYSEDELMRLTYIELTPKKWHSLEAKIIQEEVLIKGYSSVYEKEYIKKNGTIFPISLRTYLLKDANGNPSGMWAFVRDITERKKIEGELRRSRDELEVRVQERTAELAKANEELQAENAERKRMQKILTEQSRILEAFFTSTITPLVFLDRNFNFVRVNEVYAKACQREVSEFPGHNHFEFYPHEENEAIFRQVVETKTTYQAIAKPFSFPDDPEWGVTYWDWTLTPLLNDNGEVEFLVFSLEDVGERKRAEEALKAEQQRFNDILEILPAYLVLLAPDYHVPFANRFFRERFGESHGRRCFEYLFGRSEPCETCETYTALKTMAPYEWEWTGPDGHNYSVFDFPFTDTDGSTLILEMGIDITEPKRAEEALKVTSLYARSLIEASLDPLVTISADGKVMDVNRATELVTGVPREQLIGSDFSDYFTEPEKAKEGYKKVFSEGSVRDYPLAIRHSSGHITEVLYSATVYRNEAGEVQGVFAAARDITERKRAEEALRESENRLRSLSSQLLTVQENERKRVAREIHDGIGQMLTAIKFKVEDTIQQKGKGNAKIREKSLETIIPLIQGSVEEVRRIQMDLRPSTLDDLGILATIDWFCREFGKIYSTIHIEKLINIKENEVPALLKTVIFRVMQEALNNIAKHSKADLVHLSLKKKDDRIELVVEDNGMGFDLETSKRGLGLTSMKERIEYAGGSFFIQSVSGKGTTIRAILPI